MKDLFFILSVVLVSLVPVLEVSGLSNQSINDSRGYATNNSTIPVDESSSMSNVSRNDRKNTTVNNSDDISVDIITQYSQYVELQRVEVYVGVYSEKPGVIKLILEQRNSTGSVVYRTSQIVNVTDYKFYSYPKNPGTYNITVRAIQNGISEVASTSFPVISVIETNTVRLLLVSLAFFAALLVLVYFSRVENITEEILRFLFLSGIVGSILGSFLFTEIEFGKGGPIALERINQNTTGNQNTANGQLQWFFNIGGALAIPVYVIIFGLLGGYLRYLYKTSRLLIDEELRTEKEKMKKNLMEQGISNVERRIIFFQSLKDIALFFLSPILAVVVWFLFSQWEPIADSPTLLAVFSFASGLVTNEIVSTVTDFTKSNLSKRTSTS